MLSVKLSYKSFQLPIGGTGKGVSFQSVNIRLIYHKGRRQKKKRDYVGKIPKGRTPPPPPPFGKPLLSKKKLGLFFILEPQEHFWSSPKNHNFK